MKNDLKYIDAESALADLKEHGVDIAEFERKYKLCCNQGQMGLQFAFEWLYTTYVINGYKLVK